jgi:PAT family beta-lactamase induction signal transducer AmpG
MKFASLLGQTYRDRRLLIILAMGFSSGLPLALTLSTLSYWLRTLGVSKTSIGLFGIATLAYNFKFVWAPLFDHVTVPLIGRLGRRRSWMIVMQILVAAAMVATGMTDPATGPFWTAAGIVCLAFFSASQDIVIDAYRVEILDETRQGAGAAVTQYGYRIGMLTSGAGALYLSEILPWSGVYAAMAALMGVGVLTALISPEPDLGPVAVRRAVGFGPRLREAIIDPFVEFTTRTKWVWILLLIILFKLADAVAERMTIPLYVDLGFTADEIATGSKIFGVLATLLGIFVGGWLVGAIGLFRALLIGAIAQSLTLWSYAGLAIAGHDRLVFTAALFLDNFSAGAAAAAFVAYVAMLCSRQHTATQLALLTSLAIVGRTFFASGGGWLADHLSWVQFFLSTSLLGIPGIVLLIYLRRSVAETASSTHKLVERV